MAKREYKPTSKSGEVFIAPHKEGHKEKILKALEELRVGGTHEEIASTCGLRPDQVWKRLSELCRDKKIFDTGITRPLKSSVPGIVWQMKELPPIERTVYNSTPSSFIQPVLF